MKKHVIFIRSVLVVFGALLLSRIPALVDNTLDPMTLVSSVVEVVFVIWGLAVLRR